MTGKQNAPEIRFEGFTDPWEQRKLGDCVGSTYGGGTPSTSHDEYWGGNIPWIQSSNVLENELFRIDIPKAITQDGLSKSAALQVPGNSIAVVTHVGVGKLVYLPFPYATSQDFVSLSELKGDANFLCYAIHRKLQSELHMVQGSAIKGITKEELLGKAIFLPAAEEQKLVGNQMRAIDNLITLHQRKYDKLCTVKKSMLDKMFPKPGETEPEIRFEGFTDPWEQRKLGELIQLGGSGGTPSANNPDYYGGDIPFLSIADINGRDITNTAKTLTDEGLQNSAAWIVPSGAVSLAMYASVGKVGIIRQDTATSQAFYNMVFDNEALRDFVFTRLEKAETDSEWEPYISTGTQRNLNADKVKSFSLDVPSSEEASEISAYFANLDTLITLHQREPRFADTG